MRPWPIRTALLFLGLFFLSNAGLAQRAGNGPARKSPAGNPPGPWTVQVRNRPGPGPGPASKPTLPDPPRGPRVLDTRPAGPTAARDQGADPEAKRRASTRLVDDMDSIRQARAVTPARQKALQDDLRAVLDDPRRPGLHPIDGIANDLAWAIADGGITRASAARIAETLAVLGDPASSRDDHLGAIERARGSLAKAGVSDRDQKAIAVHLHEISARALPDRGVVRPR
ncbi:MAG: hypothetical protein U0800_16635 [Isosphaeraceae bacterium]